MKADVYSIDGKKKGDVELPSAFSEEVREDLISRAVLHELSKEYQPKGAYKRAGLQTTAEYGGRKDSYRAIKNHGISRLPREKLPKGRFGRVRIVPFAVSGRRAHPPNPDKKLVEEMNKKEYKKALRSAVAATASADLVKKRGHSFNGKTTPIVVEAKFEELSKTREVKGVLEKLGLDKELARGSKTRRRTGVIARRRGGVKRPKTVLIVVSDAKKAVKAARNLAGVDVCTPKTLTASQLAPGTKAGRLTVWTEAALKELSM